MPQSLRGRMRGGHHHADPFRGQLTHLPAAGPRPLRQQQYRIQCRLCLGEAAIQR